MKAISKSTFFVLGLGLAVSACVSLKAQETGAATSPGAVTAARVDDGARPGDSHVRIVRLSDAKGKLGLDRKTGAGFEQTMQNMPIVQGERLATADGYAEVEFEDNSTLRLAPETLRWVFRCWRVEEYGREGVDDEGREGNRVCEHGEHKRE